MVEPSMQVKSKLAEATIQLLDQTNSDDWRRIADETGLHFSWIRSVALGKVPDPGASRLETLYLALTDKPFVIVRSLVAA